METRIVIEKPGVTNRDQVKIFMVEGEGERLRSVSIVDAENGIYRVNELKPFDIVKPMLVMNGHTWEKFVKTVLEYAKTENINVDQSKLEGKLEATSKLMELQGSHLEDMRALAFKALGTDKP